ncbi:hypothetical protein KC354_g2884 [Hortaea werneckii]|nr:hypothetical protein KC354_g2884 [Hortaea werneckii]
MYTRPHSALRTLSRSAGHGGCEMNIDAQMLRPGTSASSFAASQIAQIGWLKGPDGSKSQLILYENPSLRNKSIPNLSRNRGRRVRSPPDETSGGARSKTVLRSTLFAKVASF